MAEGRKTIFRRGPDFKSPSQLESSPKRDVAIDFAELEVTCGLHTVSLNTKVDDIGQIVNRLKYLEGNPFVNGLTGEVVTVKLESDHGFKWWSLSTGERLWVKNAEHQYMCLNGDYLGSGGYLAVQYEGRWPLGAVDRHVLRFGDLMQYYEKYLIGHIEAVLDWPGLLSLSKPVVGRYDIAFDVRYRHPLHLLHSTRDMRFDGRISLDKRNSARHTKASTKSLSTQFTRYRNGRWNGRPIGVRFELRRKRQSNVKTALLGGNRNGEVRDLCNYDLVKRFLEESFKKYRLYAATPILPLRVAIARERHASVRGKLEECVNWSRTKSAGRKFSELRDRGIVIGSLWDDSFELLNVYEAFMAAFEAAW